MNTIYSCIIGLLICFSINTNAQNPYSDYEILFYGNKNNVRFGNPRHLKENVDAITFDLFSTKEDSFSADFPFQCEGIDSVNFNVKYIESSNFSGRYINVISYDFIAVQHNGNPLIITVLGNKLPHFAIDFLNTKKISEIIIRNIHASQIADRTCISLPSLSIKIL